VSDFDDFHDEVDINANLGASPDQSAAIGISDDDLISVQSTPDHRDEIEQACDMAVETLSLDHAAPT
jgi:hypothetical protein